MIRWLALLSLWVSWGCAYQSGSLIDRQHRRVFLPIFQNDTFYRDLEVDLTEQVAREIASRPGIFIVDREQADIVLVGTITGFRQRVLSEDDRDRIRESEAVATVRVNVQDARDPSRILKTFEVSDRAEFFLARGENLATAQQESFFDLARKIVNGLERDFPRASESPYIPQTKSTSTN